jgi:hypothetical protein
VNLSVDRVQMVAVNLTNSKNLSKSLIADIRIEGRPLRAGDARSQISLDPYASNPTFALNLEVKDMPLVKLNDFAKAYGNFTFESGTLKVAMEASAKNGGYRGYVEPVFDHMSIFNPAKADNPITAVWEAILEDCAQLFEGPVRHKGAIFRHLRGPAAGNIHDYQQRFSKRLRKSFRRRIGAGKKPAEGRTREETVTGRLFNCIGPNQ